MFVVSTKNGWTVHAPAKVNLALEVLGRQSTGYHEVETLLVPVRLFDTLTFYPSSDPLQLQVAGARNGPTTASLPACADDNLAVRALRTLAEYSGRQATGRLHLFKRIPIEAGLGGGSSDAAAALVAANKAWGLGYPRARLASIGATIGTDVPFFLHRGAAIGTGRGEQITPAAIPLGLPMVIAQPPVGLSTPRVFAELQLAPGQRVANPEHRCAKLAEHLRRRDSHRSWKSLMHNCLQRAAERLEAQIGQVADWMARLPVLACQMTGSGSAFFGVCRTMQDARHVAARLRGRPMRYVVATQTCL